MDFHPDREQVGMGQVTGETTMTNSHIKIILFGVVLFIMSTILTVDLINRQCHGQCFQKHDKGCQARCFDRGVCPMSGGDQ